MHGTQGGAETGQARSPQGSNRRPARTPRPNPLQNIRPFLFIPPIPNSYLYERHVIPLKTIFGGDGSSSHGAPPLPSPSPPPRQLWKQLSFPPSPLPPPSPPPVLPQSSPRPCCVWVWCCTAAARGLCVAAGKELQSLCHCHFALTSATSTTGKCRSPRPGSSNSRHATRALVSRQFGPGASGSGASLSERMRHDDGEAIRAPVLRGPGSYPQEILPQEGHRSEVQGRNDAHASCSSRAMEHGVVPDS